MTELYWEDETHDRYGVLVSHGYGAGWSSWNSPRLAYDRKVIEYWKDNYEANPKVVEEWLAKNGYPGTYVSFSNWRNLTLEWIPANVCWRIREYDGAESIEVLNLAGWNKFDKDGNPV